MKLKTLKDIARYNGIVYREELKQKAIKWIKEDIKIGKELKILKIKVEYGDLPSSYGVMIFRWMRRFNITEEDLK